jgi:hypothetical protein
VNIEHKAAGKTIAFVISTIIGGVQKYRPSIGKCFDSEGDNDSFVQITAQQGYLNLKEAQEAVEGVPSSIDEKFADPVPFDEYREDSVLWYSQIEAAQKGGTK